MQRVSVLNKQTELQAKELGRVGEKLAPRYLKRAGFQSVSNLNEDEAANYPFFDMMASRKGVLYAISIKTRNKFEAISGNLNSRYKLFKRDRIARVQKAANDLFAVPACLAIQVDGEIASVYFGIWDQFADKTGISMLPDAIQHYECLVKHEAHGLDIEHLKNTYEIRSRGMPLFPPS